MKDRLRVFAMLLAAVACPAFAGTADTARCEEAYAALPAGTILDLLDPDAPPERRTRALEGYERLADMRECPEFGYTLGQLYRHGSELPRNLVQQQDIPRAKELIQAMAMDGYLPAFADLAEMVMRHGEHREAMLWTQVYLHFSRTVLRPELDADRAHFMRTAYNGHLLTRAETVWRWQKPAVPRKRVAEDLNAWLSEHGASVRKRMIERYQGSDRRASAQEGPLPRVRAKAEDCRLNLDPRLGAATGSWIVEVLPSGQTGRVLLENFVPRAAFVETLRPCLADYRFEPLAGETPATLRISLLYGSPEGAAIRR
ncbi:hypothetical protein FQY83_00810 [Luteimonas marina]|uniref:TonB C-terminal domain-containing protein n=1 Tax=Luteimonas marina TaxID=488485 RepID=A0A5C5UCB0_9GAMM|nr:hypothetical protein [Luteimonas marina]TWT23230.1 hypothetical protein FQY83_00810 [Luteimonas marina]